MLTALEALLVSLYGFRLSSDPSSEKQSSHEKVVPPPSPLQMDDLQEEKRGSTEKALSLNDVEDNGHKHGGTVSSTGNADVLIDRQPSNCSSSSSIADDWIVNRIQAELQSDFSLCEIEMSENKSGESLTDAESPAAGTSEDQIPAVDWSRGTALIDPSSGEPLQPVTIHQPSKHNQSDFAEVKRQSSPNKKTVNSITEKGAALTAYDMISNRTIRGPLSAAALFEKEARTEVLREKPTASLQEISTTVHERWKNLREEDRKK